MREPKEIEHAAKMADWAYDNCMSGFCTTRLGHVRIWGNDLTYIREQLWAVHKELASLGE